MLFIKWWCVRSSVSHSLNEAPIPYNVLLLSCRPCIVAHPLVVPVTGLASAGLLGGVRWHSGPKRHSGRCQIETVVLGASGLWMYHVEKELTLVHKNNLATLAWRSKRCFTKIWYWLWRGFISFKIVIHKIFKPI